MSMFPLRSSVLRLAAVASLAASPAAQALTFSQAYDAARAFDSNYRAAGLERDVTGFNVPIARAALLPSLTFSASDSKVQGSRIFPNSQNQEVRTRLDYTTPQSSLQMRMPIFNYEAYSGYKLALAQTEVADEILRSQTIELMDRVAGAYLQLLLSDEGRRLAEAQVVSLQTQAAQTAQRQQRGEGTRVQVVQIEANLDVARARLVEATDQQDIARRQLARLTGIPDTVLSPLPAEVKPMVLFPDRLGDWLEMAVRESPQLRARERAAEVARLVVKRQAAAHLPRLDLTGSVARSENDSSNTVGQQSNLRAVGVQLTVPLYSGGGIDAAVQQARAREAVAAEDIRTERETLEVDVQRHFLAMTNGAHKISAYSRAADSTALAWQAARRSLEMGLGTLSDVADAQAAHFLARRDLAQARIDQILSRLRLKVRAGVPLPEVAADLDALLLASPAASPTPTQP